MSFRARLEISLNQYYALLQQKTERIKTIISENILDNSVFRHDSGLQIFCIILNVMLMLILPPIALLIFLPRLILHCCNKNKYPNILFLPEHPIVPAARICQSQITDLQERIARHQQTLPYTSTDCRMYARNNLSIDGASLSLPGKSSSS